MNCSAIACLVDIVLLNLLHPSHRYSITGFQTGQQNYGKTSTLKVDRGLKDSRKKKDK